MLEQLHYCPFAILASSCTRRSKKQFCGQLMQHHLLEVEHAIGWWHYRVGTGDLRFLRYHDDANMFGHNAAFFFLSWVEWRTVPNCGTLLVIRWCARCSEVFAGKRLVLPTLKKNWTRKNVLTKPHRLHWNSSPAHVIPSFKRGYFSQQFWWPKSAIGNNAFSVFQPIYCIVIY